MQGAPQQTFVIVSESLDAIPLAHTVARRARRLISAELHAGGGLQHHRRADRHRRLRLAPLSAAIAMSTSSLLVTGNALRLNWVRKRTTIMPSAETGSNGGKRMNVLIYLIPRRPRARRFGVGRISVVAEVRPVR